ncbi:phage antirepressor KilAC domain-containing protein [Parendozoicomonas sp. Alg238-R29]|uniref:phage antirepressor KilAC domain-containing protein n=1 Tax=Parendozoicomonas sp. Alg238-R29 TaxID=2993446 RepID=UPI00248EA63A|nr:phage antirepressor KilAC domain-containing protein [Parendozoicomonas sp. Alg238-R29]
MPAQIINQGTMIMPLAMSHIEIAEIADKRSDSVRRTVESLVEQRFIASPQIEERPKANVPGQYVKHLMINQHDSYVVMARVSPEFTVQLVDRWQELEQQAANPPAINLPDFTNPAEAARAWAEQFELKACAEQEAARLNKVCNTITRQFVPGLTVPKFCMQLNGVNTQQVNGYLVNRRVLIREKRGHRPTSEYRDSHFKLHTIENNDGDNSYQPQLTQKGSRWLYKQYLDNRLPMKRNWDGNLTHMVFSEKEVA